MSKLVRLNRLQTAILTLAKIKNGSPELIHFVTRLPTFTELKHIKRKKILPSECRNSTKRNNSHYPTQLCSLGDIFHILKMFSFPNKF